MKILIFILPCFLLSSCEPAGDTDKPGRSIKDSRIAVLPSNHDLYGRPDTALVSDSVNADELAQLEHILQGAVQDYNNTRQNIPLTADSLKQDILSLPTYYRQYLVARNREGEKIILVNCFCELSPGSGESWRKAPVFVHDGGNCYFHLTINLNRKEYYKFAVNGEA